MNTQKDAGVVQPPPHALPVLLDQRAMLEQELVDAIALVQKHALDLNVPPQQLVADFVKVAEVRSRVLQMHGVPAAQAYHAMPGADAIANANAGASQGLAGSVAGEGVDYKSKLLQAVSKKIKRPLKKGEVLYNVIPDDNGFKCVLVAEGLLDASHESGALAKSKRAAEHAAAKAALEAEFPAMAAEAKLAATFNASQPPREIMVLNSTAVAVDGKSQLMQIMQTRLRRPVTKSDVVYETQDLATSQGVGFQATVSLPTYRPAASWKGELAQSRKAAEKSAAKIAMAALVTEAVGRDGDPDVQAKEEREDEAGDLSEEVSFLPLPASWGLRQEGVGGAAGTEPSDE